MSDGTQTESDNITIHGCLECLRILDVSTDGQRAWDLSLYPVRELPDGVAASEDLGLFSATLENSFGKEYYYDQAMPDFLDEEQKKAFASAEYIITTAHNAFGSGSVDNSATINDIMYFPCGVDYASFVDYFESVFTYKYSAELLNQMNAENRKFLNVGGELYEVGTGWGGNLLYSGRKFELTSKSDSEIKFKLTAHYSYKDHITDEEYDEMPENEREYDKEFTFTMKNTPNGWRFDEYNLWL